MKTAIVRWELPIDRVDGVSLSPSEIQGVEISLSADNGQNFAVAGTVTPAGAQERTFPNLVDGDYMIRLIVIDSRGVRSINVDTPFTIIADGILAAPNPVMNVTVSLV